MSTFHPVIVRDELIQDITTNLPLEMRKGAKQNTYITQNATSQNIGSVKYTVTAPSEDTVLNRNIKMQSTIGLRINIAANSVDDNNLCFKYGLTEALSCFPVNSLINSATVTVNRTTMTVDTQNIMGTLLKMHEQDDFDEYHCPTMQDQKMATFTDMALTQSDPLASFESSKGKSVPRGSHPLDSFKIEKFVNGVSNLVATQNSTATAITNASTCTTKATDSWVIDLVYTTIEPVMFLSPLIYAKASNNGGLYGVNSFSLDLQLDNTARRGFSSASEVPMTISLTSVTNCQLLLNYLTPQDADKIAPSNSLPFTQFNNLLTTGQQATANSTSIISSNSHIMNSIPNKIYVCVRKLLSTQTIKDADSFMTINSVTINFNNKTGILSSATQHDLYKISKRNGSKQLNYEFNGRACVQGGLNKATTGSVLVLDPVLDFGLPEYLTSGSTGNMNFQITVSYTNHRDVTIENTELLVIAQYDGVFTTENGTSRQEIAVFNKAMVAEASMNQFGESRDYISKHTSSHALTNVPFLNIQKSDMRMGSGVKSGGVISGGSSAGDYTRQALSRLHG